MRFLADILEIEVRQHPDNLAAMAELGHVYTHQGRFQEGLEVDRRLARLVPSDPTVQYNLACSLALVGRVEDALLTLEKAVELGYDNPDFMERDEDLARLREEPRFRLLLRDLRRAGQGPA